MLRTFIIVLCIWLVALAAYAGVPLSKMSRLTSVEFERVRTEFVLSVLFDPDRGVSGCRAYAVNGGSIVIVSLPRTYVDPPVKDFQFSNDWIESVSAHQADGETVNLRIALNSGYSMNADDLRIEKDKDRLRLHMPLPNRVSNAFSIMSEVMEDKAASGQGNGDAGGQVDAAAFSPDVLGEAKTESGQSIGLSRPVELSEIFGSSVSAQEVDDIKGLGTARAGFVKFAAISLGLSGLLLVGFGIVKRFRRTGFGSAGPRIVARSALGFKKYLAVVEFEGFRYLISVGPHDTVLLARLDAEKQNSSEFSVMVNNEARDQRELSTIEQIKSRVAMLNPLGKR